MSGSRVEAVARYAVSSSGPKAKRAYHVLWWALFVSCSPSECLRNTFDIALSGVNIR